ncbi:hypothetical protein [Nitrosospira sp. Nsp13]|uniref:hypothetical protein n=1 Tax=Nitrosospira sp. Nsp13 TaxID=1855332 RepID=UPI000B838E33|nr:hypothetical protein [Nitrosospira sp. Nsp13]
MSLKAAPDTVAEVRSAALNAGGRILQERISGMGYRAEYRAVPGGWGGRVLANLNDSLIVAPCITIGFFLLPLGSSQKFGKNNPP